MRWVQQEGCARCAAYLPCDRNRRRASDSATCDRPAANRAAHDRCTNHHHHEPSRSRKGRASPVP